MPTHWEIKQTNNFYFEDFYMEYFANYQFIYGVLSFIVINSTKFKKKCFNYFLLFKPFCFTVKLEIN